MRNKIINYGKLTFILSLLGLVFAELTFAQIAEKTVAPEITLEAVYNKEDKIIPTLSSLKGKIIVLDFWATWCGPCIGAFPKYNSLNNKYKSQGVNIIAISDDDKETLENFLTKASWSFWIGRDDDKQDFTNYKVVGRPQVFLINRDGVVVYQGREITEEMLKEVIETNNIASLSPSLTSKIISDGGFSPGDDPIYTAVFTMLGNNFNNRLRSIEQFTIRRSLENKYNGYAYDKTDKGFVGITYSGGNLSEIFQFFNNLSSPIWVKNTTSNNNRYDLIYWRKNESVEIAKDELSQSLQEGLSINIRSNQSEEIVNILALEKTNENLKIRNQITDATLKLYLPISTFVRLFENKTKEYFLIDESLKDNFVFNKDMSWKELMASSPDELANFLKTKGVVIRKEKKLITLFEISPRK